jgi:hypothetical protein
MYGHGLPCPYSVRRASARSFALLRLCRDASIARPELPVKSRLIDRSSRDRRRNVSTNAAQFKCPLWTDPSDFPLLETKHLESVQILPP